MRNGTRNVSVVMVTQCKRNKHTKRISTEQSESNGTNDEYIHSIRYTRRIIYGEARGKITTNNNNNKKIVQYYTRPSLIDQVKNNNTKFNVYWK